MYKDVNGNQKFLEQNPQKNRAIPFKTIIRTQRLPHPFLLHLRNLPSKHQPRNPMEPPPIRPNPNPRITPPRIRIRNPTQTPPRNRPIQRHNSRLLPPLPRYPQTLVPLPKRSQILPKTTYRP